MDPRSQARATDGARRGRAVGAARITRPYANVEQSARLRAAIAKLPAKQKMVLEFRVFDDLSFKEHQLPAAGQLPSKQIERRIDEAVANQKAFWDLEAKRLAELRKIRSPAQTAQLLVVLPQFERRIQSQLRKAS